MQTARLGFATVLLGFSLAVPAEPAEEFTALLDEVWEWQLAENPMFASQLGDQRYNDRWSDQSIAAIERRQQQTREFLQRVYAIDRSALSAADQLNYELFRRQLQDHVDSFAFNEHLIPFNQRGGVQNLDDNTNRILNIVKAKYDLHDKGEAVEFIVNKYIEYENEPE